MTGKAPMGALKDESPPHRTLIAQVSKTGSVEFKTNRYSAPSEYSGAVSEIKAYPDHLANGVASTVRLAKLQSLKEKNRGRPSKGI